MDIKSDLPKHILKPLPVTILLVISFIEGAAVMVIELLGAKIIAPYYGTSLYVWSSVLGTTLGALAIGYYLGGYISNRFPQNRSLFIMLLIGAFFTTVAPMIAPFILERTDSLGVRMGSLVSVFCYLLIPIACLGSISPIIIQHINTDKKDAGKSAGTVYAISTVGGILATFIAGFYLIPEFGIRATAILVGSILALISVVYFIMERSMKTVLSAAVLGMVCILLFPSFKTSDSMDIVYSSVGLLGEWYVLDKGNIDGKGEGEVERRLLLNGIDQTYTVVGYEPLSIWIYAHKIAAITSVKPKGSKALLLGMGGGSIAHEMTAMEFDLDIVELDGRIEQIAEDYFAYDPSKSNLIIDDARHFIRTTDEKYDVVVIDLAIAEVQPSHVFTIEGFDDLSKVLKKDGLVVLNFQGNIDNPKYSLGPKSIYKTMEAAGFNVSYFSQEDGADESAPISKDLFFLASKEQLDYQALMENLRYNAWFPYADFYYEDLVSGTDLDCSEALILTDDKPKLELLNAEAILQWRKNKIGQHIKTLMDAGLPIF